MRATVDGRPGGATHRRHAPHLRCVACREAHPNAAPAGRAGTPEEVAEVIALLACEGYATGASVLVDGGLSLAAVLALQEAVE